MAKQRTIVYTDGASSGNPGPGGWAWAVPGGRYASGAEERTTSQRMEITAAYQAVRTLPGPLEVISDSTYLVNCFRDRWHEGWIARGWRNSSRKPVANRDLWEPFVALVTARRDVVFRWVKGHDGDPMNDIVDRLAVAAAAEQEGKTGDCYPGTEHLADADLSIIERDPRLPTSRLLLVTGHRPPALGRHAPSLAADRVRKRLTEVFESRRAIHPDLSVLTGLQPGAEQVAAEAAVELAMPYVAVLAYPELDRMWPEKSRKRHTELLSGAKTTLTFEPKAPTSFQRADAAIARHDAWMARAADEAVVVWDGRDAAIGRLVRSLEDHLGDEVIVVDPRVTTRWLG